MEKEEDKTLNFLYERTTGENSNLTFDVHRKPTCRDLVIHTNTNQSWQMKRTAIHSLLQSFERTLHY